MRIIGEIEHPVLKITVFQSGNRLSVKFESGLYEQTYKFRDGEGVDSIDDVRQLVDAPFLASVESILQHMNRARAGAVSRRLPQGGEGEFEEII